MGLISWLRGDDLVPEARSVDGPTFTLGNPELAAYLGLASPTWAGTAVTERTALGLTAVYRSVALTSGVIAGLPLKSYREGPDGVRERVPTWMDDPAAAVGLTRYELVELVLVHLLVHGNAFLLHLTNGAGAIAGLQPIHPSAVTVEDGPLYRVRLANGETEVYGPDAMTHIMGLSTDGIVGLSPIAACRQALGTAVASDEAAGRMFGNGFMVGGIVTSDESLTKDDAEAVKAGLKAKMAGTKNAGDVAFVNASLKFTPWTIPAKEAEFIEQRAFGVAEVARIYGVPQELLANTGASSWGSGIQELVRGWQRFTLAPLTTRVEQRLSRLLPRGTYCEFDYAGLLQGSPAEVSANLAAEVAAGLRTVDEARRILNLPPLGAAPSNEGDADGTA